MKKAPVANEKAPILGIAALVEVRPEVAASKPSDVHGTFRQSRY
jgi:hypothetical protein